MITTSAHDLRGALPDGGALMGLDPGTKTIGVALCDRDWRFATAGQTVRRRKFAQDKAELAALIAARSVKGLVIGLPLHMDGSESPRSQAARAMARNLADIGLPILLWDERWSTAGAERGLLDQDMSRAKRATRIGENLARTGLSADVVIADALQWQPAEPFDAVLLDAPCSATGNSCWSPDSSRSRAVQGTTLSANVASRLTPSGALLTGN